MKASLAGVLKSGRILGHRLTSWERVLLERWKAECADDPIWTRIVAGARALGCWPTANLDLQLIWYVLEAKGIATSVKTGVDLIFLEEQQSRAKLLELADKADDLAQYFKDIEKYPGIAMFFQLNLKLPVTPEQEAVYRVEEGHLRVRQLQALHRDEARLLRQRAGREPKQRTFVSREKRNREVNAFIHSMTVYMKDFCGQPHRPAVAMLTNIAFRRAIDSNDVHKALEASTRRARALKRKKRVSVR